MPPGTRGLGGCFYGGQLLTCKNAGHLYPGRESAGRRGPRTAVCKRPAPRASTPLRATPEFCFCSHLFPLLNSSFKGMPRAQKMSELAICLPADPRPRCRLLVNAFFTLGYGEVCCDRAWHPWWCPPWYPPWYPPWCLWPPGPTGAGASMTSCSWKMRVAAVRFAWRCQSTSRLLWVWHA